MMPFNMPVSISFTIETDHKTPEEASKEIAKFIG
jgi:hypothetical protein